MSGTPEKPQQPLGVYKCKEMIHDIFLQTGNKDRLMAHIRHKTAQQGWTWTMRDEFIEYIKKRGPDNVNVSHMIGDLAPLGRELFPAELKKELLETMFEVTKNYFTIDDTITPITDPDNANSEAEKTFLYQSKDVKPDPGLGVGVEIPESPPPSPPTSNSTASTPRQSPGPVSSTSSNPPTTRQSPVQSQANSRQSPGAVPRQSPVSGNPRPLTPQPLPPPPVLRPETVSTPKVEPVVTPELEDEEEEQEDEDDDDEDARNNEEDDEDELMDV